MIHLHISHIDGEGLPLNKVKYSDEVTLFILDRISLHEIFVIGDQVKDAGLLLGASKTLKFYVPDTGHEFFIKYKLHDLQASVTQINGTLDPKLDFIIKPESLFFGIMANEIGSLFQDNHVVIFHTKKVTVSVWIRNRPGTL